MRIVLYPKLAAGNLKKNGRLFAPFMLTCAGMVMMFYIITFLALSDVLEPLVGGATLRQIFALGSWVIAVFSGIFLFYTNSFLMKRRKKEFGIYSILGMGKMNIARVLFWELLFTALISVGAGLAAGIAFSKFAELGMVRVMHGEVTYRIVVSPLAAVRSVQVFGVIFLLLMLNSARQVGFSSAVSLVRSESTGEKAPKANVFLGLLGVALLAAAYYLAVNIKDPVAALLTFFAAVIMVIAGTYLVMIAGSVLFCRLLQKNKRYYYKPNHFVSVSSMAFRMKRNGAGLASICILATMVLVLTASTTCLYFGEESVIDARYPRDLNARFYLDSPDGLLDENVKSFESGLVEKLNRLKVTPQNAVFYRCADFYGVVDGQNVRLDTGKAKPSEALTSLRAFYITSLDDYNRALGLNETLDDGEALLYTVACEYKPDALSFVDAGSFKIKKRLKSFIPGSEAVLAVQPSIALVVPNCAEAAGRVYGATYDAYQDHLMMFNSSIYYSFDAGVSAEEQKTIYRSVFLSLQESEWRESLGYHGYGLSSREVEKEDFYSVFGAMFYIGIMLSLVFILAAVLIIYYKQVSEGYEDRARFEIMQKVGMTKRDIKKSINSQLLTVFFLPLVLAALHISFAFPMIRRLLLLFALENVNLFAFTTAVSVAVFGLFYAAVYKLTSAAYYKIVSGAN